MLTIAYGFLESDVSTKNEPPYLATTHILPKINDNK
jgi:hypothetical protein